MQQAGQLGHLEARRKLCASARQLGGWTADRVGLGRVFGAAWNILRRTIVVFLMILAMAILYYFALDVEWEWKGITPGSICAVIGWLAASLGFAYYANN